MASIDRVNSHHGKDWDQWLRSEGIVKDTPKIQFKRRRIKSIPGQLSLLDTDETGGAAEVVETDAKKRSKKK